MTRSDDDAKLALYRKYRPVRLDQIVGQPQVTDILAAAAHSGSFAHAYLFTGQRGTGKTTVARILAHLVNNIDYLDNINSDNVDIVEIDAASNNGVDDVRAIRDSVNYAPMKCSHKVYIIDEFHMLSKPAFNALLKTIEEPPEYAIFILATTELNKVPATILSRVQRFHFKPLSVNLLVQHLHSIADQEKIAIDEAALELIAQRSDGSVRDSLTLLDQLSGNKQITASTVNDILGLVSNQLIDQLIDYTDNGHHRQVITTVNNIVDDGTSPIILAEQLIKQLEVRASQTARLYQLTDRLLDVSKASLPKTKLLAILVGWSSPDTSTTAMSRPEVKPVDSSPSGGSNKAEPPNMTNLSASSGGNPDTVSSDARPVGPKAASQPDRQPIDNLVWEDLLQQLVDQDRPLTRTLLERCDYRYNADTNTLTLYFTGRFYRKRARSDQIHQALVKTFEELYHTCPFINISDDGAPADSELATVLKVVGGEVTSLANGAI